MCERAAQSAELRVCSPPCTCDTTARPHATDEHANLEHDYLPNGIIKLSVERNRRQAILTNWKMN